MPVSRPPLTNAIVRSEAVSFDFSPRRLAFIAARVRSRSSSARSISRTGPAGSVATSPPDLWSQNGVLNVAFDYYTTVDDAGRTLFCFTAERVESAAGKMALGGHD